MTSTAWLTAPLVVLALMGAAKPMPTTLYDYSATRIDGQATKLAAYKGKVVLVVNTASKCGFTSQYEGLQKLHQRFATRGLAVLGFPSNDFLGQEPGTNAEIKAFCDAEYGVDFDMFAKVSVKGDAQVPLFHWLTAVSPETGAVRWNFEKFLIDRQGKVVARYRSMTKPDSPEVVAAIEAQLARK